MAMEISTKLALLKTKVADPTKENKAGVTFFFVLITCIVERGYVTVLRKNRVCGFYILPLLGGQVTGREY